MKSVKSTKPESLPIKTRLLGWTIARAMRLIAFTLKIRLDDQCGILTRPPEGALIWACWHNRMLLPPCVYYKHLRGRPGAVLTSTSKDGAILSETMRNFGVSAVRGSSSRRGGQAMVELLRCIRNGCDVVMIPDGPRGPQYKLKPGIIKLAQKTGAPIFPILIEYDNYWELKSWDRFRIPKPFSKVVVTLAPYENIAAEMDEETFEQERLRIENLLGENEG